MTTTFVRSRRPAVRFVQDPTVYTSVATMIPDGMHGHEKTYAWATMIPDGMHGFVDKRRLLESVVEKLIAQGVDPIRARTLVDRAAWRKQSRGSGLDGMGDVASDGMTWVTYGNDIIARSKTGNVGAEALKASQNINSFLGNRGDELQAASPDTVDALGEMVDKLARIASGQIKYDSVAGAFFDELGNAIRGEVIVGLKGVAAAPGKILEVVPWYVWAGGAAAGVLVLSKALKIW